jgi:hypothetical protein
MKTSKIVILLLVSIALFVGCKKDKTKGCKDPNSITYNPEAEEDDGSCEYAGVGGNLTIVAYPKHHGKETRPYNVYVKFNTQEFPGENQSLYDLQIAADTTENHIEIENLKRGYYYIYMTAYDTSISAIVTGGIPTTVTMTAGEMDLDVPVTE